jgi:hypothetical protein
VKLVAEAGDSSGTQRKGTSAVGSGYQATASEDCNRLRRPSVSYSDLCSKELCAKSSIKPITNPNPVYSHSYT